MKKVLGLVLAVCLIVSVMAVPVMAKADLPFKDVKTSDWFYDDVDQAWRLGLINGKTEDMFMPDDNLTYAEAVKLAACMNQYYTEGKVTLKVKGDPWYDTYVEYCNDNGIIKKGYSWDKNATRAGYMEIFANSLPDEALKEMNYIEDGSIPDVKSSADYYDAVYKLYRAGILTGVDKEHNCNPTANIKRSEVAAIITRMMDEDSRQEFTMGDLKNADKDKDKDDTDKDKDKDDTDKDKDDKDEDEVKPFKVKADPASIEVAPGEEVTVKAVAEGGKEPYKYRWYGRKVFSGIRQYSYGALDDEESEEAGFHVVGSTDEAELTFYVDSKEVAAKFSVLFCDVTDADGKKLTAKVDAAYLGDGFLNDMASNDFLMYVEDVYWITDRGLIATGRITSGKVNTGDKLKLLRADGTEKEVTVASIEMFRKILDSAEKGDNVGLLLEGLGDTNEEAKKNIGRGEALVGADTDYVSSKHALIEVTMLTKDEGGRTTAPSGDGSYKPQAYFGSTDTTATLYNNVYDEEAGEWTYPDFVPGETYDYVEMELIHDRFMFVGQEGTLREGGRNVANFKVLQVFRDEWYD